MLISTPLAPRHPGHALRSLWSTAGRWQPQVVLATADDALRRALLPVFARGGFDVAATNDVGLLGALASRRWSVAGSAPEVVLVEWLPSGATLAALAAAGAALRGSAVVVLSPGADESVRAAATAAGAAACVEGPIDAEALRDAAFDLVA